MGRSGPEDPSSKRGGCSTKLSFSWPEGFLMSQSCSEAGSQENRRTPMQREHVAPLSLSPNCRLRWKSPSDLDSETLEVRGSCPLLTSLLQSTEQPDHGDGARSEVPLTQKIPQIQALLSSWDNFIGNLSLANSWHASKQHAPCSLQRKNEQNKRRSTHPAKKCGTVC